MQSVTPPEAAVGRCWGAGGLLCLGPLTHVSHNIVSEGESSNPGADPLLF